MKFLLVVAILVGGSWYYFKPEPPGQGPEAQAAMRAAQPVLQALEAYRTARGVYPHDLDDLSPEFLSGRLTFSNGSQPEYERLGPSYQLTLNYTNPLPVHCAYRPGAKWKCEWF